ncbi:MAG: hypothetical protein M5U34_12065, partial [Chloroflexi bacterium]|nr:hypothetical protein [Chloroflexota bacterium]
MQQRIKNKNQGGSGLLQHVTSQLTQEAQSWQPDDKMIETAAPVAQAKKIAMAQLAVGLFGDDDNEESLTPAV